MKTRFAVLTALFLLLCFLSIGSVVVAEVVPPGFDDPVNNPTGQKWFPQPFGEPPMPNEPWPEPEPLPPGSIPPSVNENPFGEPHVDLGDGWESQWMNPPGTDPNDDTVQPIPTWHYNEDLAPNGGNGRLTIHIPNSPDQNPMKQVWFSIVADKSVSDAAREIGVNLVYEPPLPDGEAGTATWDPNAWVSEQFVPAGSSDGGVWYRYAGMVTIKPNPQSETLEFEILDCTNIAEIEVRSVCIPVPEPGSITLLTCGLLAGFGLLRRRR